MRKELGPNIIVAADQQLFAAAVLDVIVDGVRDNLEMLHHLVHDAALDVSGVVASPTVATAAAGQFVDEVELLDDGASGDLEDTRLGAIDERDTGVLHAVEDRRQRLQVEALV